MADKRVIEQTASSEIYNDDWFLKDSVLEGTTKISKDNLIDKIGASKIKSIAEDYDSASTYNKDDFAFYENKLYRCLANNTTGTWDGTKWEEFDLPTALITTAHNIETAEFTIGTYYSADDLVLKDDKLYQCVVGHNATEWKSQFWRSVTIDEMLGYLSDSIAPEHNQSTVYAVGDLVMHNKALWRCIQAGAGAFVNANWELVTVADLIAEAGQIDDVQVKTTGDYETVVENKIAKIDLSSVTAYGEVPNLPQAIATFKDGADAPMKSLKVAIEPVQEGSGEPSPTNIRPISGRTWVGLLVTRVNVWDEEWESGYYFSNSSGKITKGSSTITIRSKNPIPIKPNKSYHIVGTIYRYFFVDNNNNVLSYGNSVNFTTPSNARFLYFYCENTTTYNNDISINYPATDTEYHVYNGQTYTIDLGGTRYGCEVDVVNGIMTVTRVIKVYSGNSSEGWYVDGTQSGSTYRMKATDVPNNIKLPSSNAEAMSAISNQFIAISADDIFLGNEGIGIPTNGSYLTLYSSVYNTNDVSLWKTHLASNPLQLVYELATPITYQLTPTAIKSLRGVNNVYANTGDVNKCVYRRDMSSTIDDIIARLEALEG